MIAKKQEPKVEEVGFIIDEYDKVNQQCASTVKNFDHVI